MQGRPRRKQTKTSAVVTSTFWRLGREREHHYIFRVSKYVQYLRRGHASKMEQRTVSKSANSESSPRRKSMRKKIILLIRGRIIYNKTDDIARHSMVMHQTDQIMNRTSVRTWWSLTRTGDMVGGKEPPDK